MSKYTAEDFANARFAEHPETDSLAVQRTTARFAKFEWTVLDGDGFTAHIDSEAMANCGWVPVPTKPTIARCQYEDATRNLNAGDRAIFSYALHIAGVEVQPAPEPTNAEKLADIYRDWYGGDEVPNSLIRFMDAAGVTAPEEK